MQNNNRETGLTKSVSLFSCAASVVLLLAFVVTHAWRIDIFMMATVFPVVIWFVAGITLALFVGSLNKCRIGLVISWLMVAIVLGDAPQSMIRSFIPSSLQDNGNEIRIVSLNCLSESDAARECMSLNPDVILLQESPYRKSLERIATDFPGYSIVWTKNASMLVRGSVTPFTTPRKLAGEFVFANVHLTNGAKFNVASLRLIPSPKRINVWNRHAWIEFAVNRRRRRKELSEILHGINSQLQNDPIVIGGDFNAPARDAIFDLLKPNLRDAFPEAGRGWGKTITNDYPVQRIDQIWISSHFRARSLTARKSVHSDHRMVVCDLQMR